MKLINLFNKKQKYKPTGNYLVDYYATHDEDMRLISRQGQVEFMTTVKYVEKYLQKGMRIIEIGASTGRYSHYFAQNGYKVDAIELIEHNIEIFKLNTKENEDISITQGNAVDLNFIDDNTYDITLLLGPMYHLYTEVDQKKAISEAIRITKPDGMIFVAYCMYDPSLLVNGFKPNGYVKDLVENRIINPDTFDALFPPKEIFKLYRTEEISCLMQSFKVNRLHFVATDGYACHMRQTMSQMDDNTYNLFLKYHFATCERQDLIGMSHHTLDIFRKE